jgi:pimeloyl-ACP methyl ester carboxylesterase
MGSGCTIVPGRIEIDGGTIQYSRSGQGPQVLLLHGLFAQKEQWHAVMCALAAQGFDAIAPDLPGFGQSTGFQVTAYDLGEQADRLRRFAHAVGLKEFDLAANSMGGTIAAIYAERYPQDLHRLAFIGPPLGVVEWGPRVRQAIEDGINPFIPVDADQFDLEMKLLFADPPAIAPEVRDASIKGYVELNRSYQQVWDIVNLYDTALDQPLPVDIPVFILWGEGDGIYPVDGAPKLQARLPGSKLITLPRAGHLPMLERPAETAARLIAFLRETL